MLSFGGSREILHRDWSNHFYMVATLRGSNLSIESLRTHIRVALLFFVFVALNNAALLLRLKDVKSCQAVGAA